MPQIIATRRCHLTVKQKLDVIAHFRLTDATQKELAAWASQKFLPTDMCVSRQAVGRILHSELRLSAVPERRWSSKRLLHDPVFNTFDNLIAEMVDAMDDAPGVDVSGAMIIEAAAETARELDAGASRPAYSHGWLYKFQKRWGYQLRRKQGEAASVDAAAAQRGREKMLRLTRLYERKDVYNMDETSFFYRAVGKTTLSRRKKVIGEKGSKDRMTLALCANADGSHKLPPLFVGRSKVPIALRGRNVVNELGVIYTHSKRAWMTTKLFYKWLGDVDEEMRKSGRHILLLVDNAAPHMRPLTPLMNVRLEFLPANSTSVLQPMDQGIISCVKRKFSQLLARLLYDDYKRGRPRRVITVYDAMQWAKEAWDIVSLDTIRNCWFHSGVVSDARKVTGILNPFDPMDVTEINN